MAARFTDDLTRSPVRIPGSRTNGWRSSWKKFLADMMYLRGYVVLYPNFPNQASFSTNHMEPGAHIGAADNAVVHRREDFEVPLIRPPRASNSSDGRVMSSFSSMLPDGRLPPLHRLPVLDLFHQPSSLKGLKAAGSRLRQDVLACGDGEIVAVDRLTGGPVGCSKI
jgi:hypothetical protein